ncbi:hypothetical protein BJ508DRAFT_341633 [Ascobolus immersus RN42]|uniref:Uncharacterized protein n=1 Tax=Ascobolus immersus RN42 TaxID=1160509 RepID=A0A3N4HGR4_ASCIM|nr:hypothetical protein BJ508DRAFT_341633 [Ascobolus immersus RN42]
MPPRATRSTRTPSRRPSGSEPYPATGQSRPAPQYIYRPPMVPAITGTTMEVLTQHAPRMRAGNPFCNAFVKALTMVLLHHDRSAYGSLSLENLSSSEFNDADPRNGVGHATFLLSYGSSNRPLPDVVELKYDPTGNSFAPVENPDPELRKTCYIFSLTYPETDSYDEQAAAEVWKSEADTLLVLDNESHRLGDREKPGEKLVPTPGRYDKPYKGKWQIGQGENKRNLFFILMKLEPVFQDPVTSRTCLQPLLRISLDNSLVVEGGEEAERWRVTKSKMVHGLFKVVERLAEWQLQRLARDNPLMGPVGNQVRASMTGGRICSLGIVTLQPQNPVDQPQRRLQPVPLASLADERRVEGNDGLHMHEGPFTNTWNWFWVRLERVKNKMKYDGNIDVSAGSDTRELSPELSDALQSLTEDNSGESGSGLSDFEGAGEQANMAAHAEAPTNLLGTAGSEDEDLMDIDDIVTEDHAESLVANTSMPAAAAVPRPPALVEQEQQDLDIKRYELADALALTAAAFMADEEEAKSNKRCYGDHFTVLQPDDKWAAALETNTLANHDPGNTVNTLTPTQPSERLVAGDEESIIKHNDDVIRTYLRRYYFGSLSRAVQGTPFASRVDVYTGKKAPEQNVSHYLRLMKMDMDLAVMLCEDVDYFQNSGYYSHRVFQNGISDWHRKLTSFLGNIESYRTNPEGLEGFQYTRLSEKMFEQQSYGHYFNTQEREAIDRQIDEAVQTLWPGMQLFKSTFA